MTLLSYEIEHFNPYSPRVSELTAIPSGPDILVLPGQQHGGHFSPPIGCNAGLDHHSVGSLDGAESDNAQNSPKTAQRRPAPIPVTVIHHGETRPESNSSKVADTTESPLSITPNELDAVQAQVDELKIITRKIEEILNIVRKGRALSE